MNSPPGCLYVNDGPIPFGFDMDLTNSGGAYPWIESIRLAIDQYPNYLDPFNEVEFEGKKDYWLGIKNTCTLGPTGLPILPPTPVTPWVVTLNVWLINVKGKYAEFKVIDSSDETLFNPLFGHEPQIYVRKDETIRDAGGEIIGDNTFIIFDFATVAFGVVPSWGMMVGDIGDYVEEDGWE